MIYPVRLVEYSINPAPDCNITGPCRRGVPLVSSATSDQPAATNGRRSLSRSDRASDVLCSTTAIRQLPQALSQQPFESLS
jgi:hypothetical protein